MNLILDLTQDDPRGATIVLVGGEKGGVGKTTLAVNLAAMRSRAGHDVLLVDADRQASANLWAGIRQDDGRVFGEFRHFRKCGRQVDRYFGADFCLTCRRRESRREQAKGFEKALESSGRHDSRHRMPRKR